MRVIRGLTQLTPWTQGCLLTIGNFDGVHLGHQALIQKLAQRARVLRLPVVVMLFEPQPLEYFLTTQAPARLTSLREKVVQFSRLPVDSLLVLKFNQALAELSAEDFVRKILLDALNVKHLVVGDDFHFGKNRTGNFIFLQMLGARYGFTVEDTQAFLLNGVRVSSTAVRSALSAGDLTTAAHLLGRNFALSGRVVYGKQLGRTLGYPTINIPLRQPGVPLSGVFAIELVGLRERPLQGVANIGIRPTLAANGGWLLEAHLFDFNDQCYGCSVEIQLLHKLRDEQTFSALSALKAQIAQDVLAAKQFFADNSV